MKNSDRLIADDPRAVIAHLIDSAFSCCYTAVVIELDYSPLGYSPNVDVITPDTGIGSMDQ